MKILSLARRAAEILLITVLAKLPMRPGRKHNLDGQVVVSLTSYPPRYSTLHLTLRTLLSQSVKPDRLILWIAEDDFAALPARVLRLRRYGLQIRKCEDVRSFNKIVPALEAFPDAFLVTADDDLFYQRGWLEGLTTEVRAGVNEVVCYRALRFHKHANDMAPVREWEHDVYDVAALSSSTDLLPTTGFGVVYPPKSLHKDVTDREIFGRLTPYCDDTWLTWMVYRNGATVRVARKAHKARAWKGTAATGLFLENLAGRMDGYIKAMSAEYGSLPKLRTS